MNVLTYYSFFITCSFLVTTGTITFIEALRTDIVPMRHILNLETCISIVAAYFYGKFITTLEPLKEDITTSAEKIDKNELNKLEKKINVTRYVDWMITTPIMLLVLILAFQYNSKKSGVNFSDYLLILMLNYGMLGTGYLGEVDKLDKLAANVIGFIFFGLLYGFIYYKYLLKTKNGNNINNKLLYLSFFILWAFYGVFYLMKDSIKNTGYNILDLFSKCFVGIYFWSYSSNIFL
tara:strand:+ start:1322 stop:2026 length:705 start_codon:yes stop_codon:yes gene_type:complete